VVVKGLKKEDRYIETAHETQNRRRGRAVPAVICCTVYSNIKI